MTSPASIRSFYSSKVILVTGGTGLLGILLVDKLLRAFPDLETIYVVARCKRDETIQARRAKFCRDKIFSDTHHNLLDKIVFIEGQLEKLSVGINKESIQTLRENVEIAFHCGSNVNWHIRLDKAINTNLRGTIELLNIFKGSTKLKSFVYVSTVYSNLNGHRELIEEQIYAEGLKPKELIYLANTNPTDGFKEKMLLGDFINTYVFSKNATERALDEYRTCWPIGVFRASNLIAAYAEPYPYCLPKKIGMMRLFDESAKGFDFLSTVTETVNGNITPTDMTVNALIATAYDIATQTNNKIKVFNYTNYNHPLSINLMINYYVNKIRDRSEKDDQAHELFRKGALQFSTSYDCLTSNVEQLWGSMSEEEKDLLPFDLKVIDWKDYLENMHEMVNKVNMFYE